jgi:hypothetical protein
VSQPQAASWPSTSRRPQPRPLPVAA